MYKSVRTATRWLRKTAKLHKLPIGLMTKSCFAVALLTSSYADCNVVSSDPDPSSRFFFPQPRPGDRFSTVFSITKERKLVGVDETVKRMSGTGFYTVIDRSARGITVSAVERYDGQPFSRTKFRISPNGNAYYSDKGVCRPNTDASGPMYNQAIWGTAPPHLAVGNSWASDLASPWEMGPSAKQRVTIVRIDPANATITLRREGEGSGPSAGDPATIGVEREGITSQTSYHPGATKWIGYTTFRAGFVESDELMMTRAIELGSGPSDRSSGTERTYMLLNAAPAVTE